MMRYPNLPSHQWFTQLVVDRFNRDEKQWQRVVLERLEREFSCLLSRKRKSTKQVRRKGISIPEERM